MNAEITRYDVAGWEADVDESPTGPYVLFSDHEKALAEATAERDQLKAELSNVNRMFSEYASQDKAR